MRAFASAPNQFEMSNLVRILRELAHVPETLPDDESCFGIEIVSLSALTVRTFGFRTQRLVDEYRLGGERIHAAYEQLAIPWTIAAWRRPTPRTTELR